MAWPRKSPPAIPFFRQTPSSLYLYAQGQLRQIMRGCDEPVGMITSVVMAEDRKFKQA
jgi:hypothetical protein